MSYHDWSDKDFDWKGLSDAEEQLTTFCRRYGRLGGSSKEKFGQLRFYPSFGFSIHYLLLPGYHHYGWMPKWLIAFDWRVFMPVCNFLHITHAWLAWQRFIYKVGYRRILARFPHLREEIAGGADYPEYFAYSMTREVKVDEDGDSSLVSTYLDKDGAFLCAWQGSVPKEDRK